MNSQDLGVGNGRYFGSVRPSEHAVRFVAPDDEGIESTVAAGLLARIPETQSRFQPLPAPTGSAPYRLPLSSLLAADHMQRIVDAKKLVFHAVGDTGGSVNDTFQREVGRLMELDFRRPSVADIPSFFFHLGDVVYFKGEAANYYPQFYDAYEFYRAPIVAIPGNHDAEVNPGLRPLDAFVRNFCSPSPVHSPDALHIRRHTMTQPNVYFTLETPLATIVGLCSNVPEGGVIEQNQLDWFIGELRHAPTDRALIVAVHHPLFSADTSHSGSPVINAVFEQAISASDRVPDLVLHGHVHNYQRFTWHVRGREVPVIVAGAGGYRNLHHVGRPQGIPLRTPYRVEGVPAVLESYTDDRHGFLRLEVTAQRITGKYYAIPLAGGDRADRMDLFHLDLATHRLGD